MATTNKSKTGNGATKSAPKKAGAVAEQVKPNEVTPTTQEAPETPANAEQAQTIENAEDAEKRVKAEERYAEVYKELHEVTGEYPDPQLNVEQLEELLQTKKQEKIDAEAQEKESKLQEDLAKQKALENSKPKPEVRKQDPNKIWVQDQNKTKRQISRMTWDILKKTQTDWKEVPEAPIEVQNLEK